VKRRLKQIALGLLLLLVVLGGVLVIPPSWPEADPPPSPPAGLDRRCTVVRDHFDVPHISAKSPEAAAYCFGRLHARDRAWQLDFLRRLALGRLAERYGIEHAEQDFFFRLLDIAGQAQRWRARLEQQGGSTHRLLRYYVWGINAGLDQGVAASYQFQELGDSPAPWRLEHTLALGLLQSFYQTRKTFIDDLRHAALRRKLGAGAYARLYGPKTSSVVKSTTIIKPGEHPLVPRLGRSTPTRRPTRSPGSTRLAALINYLDRVSPGAPTGSNNWVVAPARSASGHALLANDPHLGISTPSFWYEVHLRVDAAVGGAGLDVAGFGFPGTPGLYTGHNRHVAWGLTNGYSNSADVFKVEPDDEGRFKLGKKTFTRRTFRPIVRVRFGPLKIPVFWKSFYRSEVGPFLPLPKHSEGTMLLRWTGLHVSDRPGDGTFAAALALMRARDVREADRALRGWRLPCWNFVFADTAGGIGYRQVGLVARRQTGVRGVVPGSDERQQWLGFLSPDQMPALLDPARGFIASANNQAFPPGYPHFMGQAYSNGARAGRIEALLREREKLTPLDLQRIQLDCQVPQAALLLPRMLEMASSSRERRSPLAREALKRLRGWNLQARRALLAPTIFRVWADLLAKRLFGDLKPAPGDAALLRVLKGEIKAPARARVDKVLHETLEATVKRLTQTLGKPDRWRWGRIHREHFRSLLKNRSGWQPDHHATDGGRSTINVAPLRAKGDGVTHAASLRLVVELRPGRVRSWGVLAGKQIDARPRELGAQQQLWLEGKYRQRPFTPDEVRAAAKSTVTISF